MHEQSTQDRDTLQAEKMSNPPPTEARRSSNNVSRKHLSPLCHEHIEQDFKLNEEKTIPRDNRNAEIIASSISGHLDSRTT